MNPTTLLTGLGAAITADPSLGGASTTGRESNPGGDDLFLALVNGLLQGSSQEDLGAVSATPAESATTGPAPAGATTGPPPSAVPGAAPVPTDETQTDPAADGSATQPAQVPTDLGILPPAFAMTPLVPQPVVPTGTGRPGKPATAVASTEATTATAVPATATPPTALSAGDPAPMGTGSGADPHADNSQSPADSSVPTPTTEAPDRATAPASSGARADARADAVPTQPTGAPAPVASITAPSPVTTSATSSLPRVADQVFPEVLRASSNAANGTSRVTVKLNPESLGEVRVVLTQRGGELEVTLAGGTDARRALTEGAPELRRLLESVGRADSRIFIRDLPTAAASAPVVPASGPSTRTDVSTDLAGGAWSGAGSPGGEPAPDRESSRHHPGSSTATDGIPSVTIASRPIQTVGRSHAGLDLSM